MGGYNTVYESLARGVPLLAMPRRKPREEQWERCRRLAALGHLNLLDDSELADPHATATAIRDALVAPQHHTLPPLPCNGAEVTARLCLHQRRNRSGTTETARFGC